MSFQQSAFYSDVTLSSNNFKYVRVCSLLTNYNCKSSTNQTLLASTSTYRSLIHTGNSYMKICSGLVLCCPTENLRCQRRSKQTFKPCPCPSASFRRALRKNHNLYTKIWKICLIKALICVIFFPFNSKFPGHENTGEYQKQLFWAWRVFFSSFCLPNFMIRGVQTTFKRKKKNSYDIKEKNTKRKKNPQTRKETWKFGEGRGQTKRIL